MLEDHHHEDSEEKEHYEEVFSDFHAWISVPCVIILLFVITLGSLANSFILYCVVRKKIGTSAINPVLLATSTKNLLAIGTCIPIAVVMICMPDTISEVTCHIQENITFIVLFGGFLYPALLSVVQCDHARQQFGQKRKPAFIWAILAVTTLLIVVLGIQGLFDAEDLHGCHLWSRRVDAVVLTYIYSVVIAAFLSFVTMGMSYFFIYKHATAHGNSERPMSDRQTEGPANISHTGQPPHSDRSSEVHVRQKTTTAVIKPMLCIVVTNFLFSLPWQILYGVTIIGKITTRFDELRVLAMCMIYLPIATDPVTFVMFSTKGKNALRSFYRGRKVNPIVRENNPSAPFNSNK